MKKDVFSVKFISVRNSFLYLSKHWLWKLNDTHRNIATLAVEYGCNQKAYFSWSAEASPIQDDSVVCLNSIYAHALGIQEGDKVIISLHDQVHPVSHINVVPLSSDDWQILMLKSSDVQSSVLDQVRVVWPGQVLIIWVSVSFHVRVTVETLHPSYEVGILQPFTEVVVSSPEIASSVASGKSSRNSRDDDPVVPDPLADVDSSDQSMLARFFSGIGKWFPGTIESRNKKLHEGCENGPSKASDEDEIDNVINWNSINKVNKWICRVHPIETANSGTNNAGLFYHPYNIYMCRKHLVSRGVDISLDGSIILCKITKVSFPTLSADKSSPSEDLPKSKTKDSSSSSLKQPCIFVRLCFIEEEGSVLQMQFGNHPRHQYALFTRTAMAALQLSVGAKVHAELIFTEKPPPNVMELRIAPYEVWDESLDSIDVVFRRHVATVTHKSSLLINSNMTLPIRVSSEDVRDIHMTLVPASAKYVVLDMKILEKCKLCVENARVNDDNKIKTGIDDSTGAGEKLFGSLKAVLDEGLEMLKLGLQIHEVASKLQYENSPLSAMNVLIVGKMGSGKSTLSKAMCHQLGKPPHYVHSIHVDCRYLKGKKVETLQKMMSQWLEESVFYQPSVLVLDDLDAIVGVLSSPDDGTSAEGLYYTRVGERLVDTLREFQNVNDICVVGTTSSLKKLDHSVMAPRGRHVFHTVLEIPELSKADRVVNLEHVLCQISSNNGNLPPLDLDTIANKTEGYVIQDLVDLVDKATFEMWKRSVSSDSCASVTDVDLQEAVKNMIPLSLRGVSLFRDPETTWDDVGGLVEVKHLLEQILMWPSQYPEVFMQCPLRRQSGVLLYGAPGTGKTYLAGAIAQHCGLNFIIIKGPELLSKYIGASEESVRNVFEKAQSAKPCILFFDEFDSLAPRRGHDSTGVTDRVVNQLLTQLDGAESLEGVWVVAATSRPDLLDPALLRPGRLDYTLLCPLPHQDDRVSILRALSRKLLLADNVDLVEVASGTAGFTGADLQAVLYTAQLSATNVPSNLPDVLPAGSGLEVSFKSEDDTVSDGRRMITQQHLMAALRGTRPSLTPQERLKYELIYQKFSNAGASHSAQEVLVLPQRATLA